MENVKQLKKNKNVDMTTGKPLVQIILFTLPLLLGNVFQQLYNICDSAVVGKFVGDDAMAAVSSSGSLINLLIGLVQGISVGAGIIITQYFGAKQKEKMSNTIHTQVLFSFVLGLILSIIGYILAPTLLKLMNTDEDILPNSIAYFHTYFIGVIFTVMYNTGSAILRAVGDSRHPLYYLIVASIINILLDFLFVGAFKWGIVGAGIATICAQFISSLLTFLQLILTKEEYKVSLKKIRFHKNELIKILAYGIPTGLQNSIISFSNVFILSNVNSFGKLATTSYGAYSKVEGFATMPSGSFSMALSTYVGQNFGAKKYDRARKGAYQGLLTSCLVTEFLGILIILFGKYILRIFTDTDEVIAQSMLQIQTITPLYFLLAYSHSMSGILRGAGYSKTPMAVMIICWVFVRIFGIPIALNTIWNNVRTIFWFYPFTWSLSFVVLTLIAYFSHWSNKKIDNVRIADKAIVSEISGSYKKEETKI